MLETIKRLLADFNPSYLPIPWNEVLQMVTLNTHPPHFLVGGVITRTILNSAYEHLTLPITNYDFAVNVMTENPQLPAGWSRQSNIHGNWKLVGDGAHVDIWPFDKWFLTVHPLTIKEAMLYLPVNIQAVAYDLTHNQIHYNAAYATGLADQCVRVLYDPEHIEHCRLVNKTEVEDLSYKAKRFGFRYTLR